MSNYIIMNYSFSIYEIEAKLCKCEANLKHNELIIGLKAKSCYLLCCRIIELLQIMHLNLISMF